MRKQHKTSSDLSEAGRRRGTSGELPGKSALLAGLLALFMLSGCSEAPRTRLGALPFPGLLTLYALADPDHLGVARYESTPRTEGEDEHSRGILYTRRGGFLDLAHVRESMDWSWYVTRKVASALENHRPGLNLDGYDGCPFHFTFNYPDDWDAMEPEERALVITELSLRIGERTAFSAMTWHEIITWFDYRTTLIVSEKGSAFTYEDTISHIVGITAADDAMRHSTGEWNRDATASLNRELASLKVVPMAEATAAVELVDGRWWKNGVCIRRYLDVGDGGGEIRPWLVRGGPSNEVTSAVFYLPTLTNVRGHDYSGVCQMMIEPSLLIPLEVQRVSQLPSHFINPQMDFPVLIAEIRREMKEEFGPNADRPYDD